MTDDRVHLTLDARKHDVAVCGAAHRDIIRTSYRPDVTCPYCLLADLETDGSPGRGQGVEHPRGAGDYLLSEGRWIRGAGVLPPKAAG